MAHLFDPSPRTQIIPLGGICIPEAARRGEVTITPRLVLLKLWTSKWHISRPVSQPWIRSRVKLGGRPKLTKFNSMIVFVVISLKFAQRSDAAYYIGQQPNHNLFLAKRPKRERGPEC